MVPFFMEHLHQDRHLDCSELLVLQFTLTNQNLHRLVMRSSLLLELLLLHSYPTGLVLDLLFCRVETSLRLLHTSLVLVDYLQLVELQKQLPSLTIFLLQIHSAQKTGDFYLKLQHLQKTLVLLPQETQRFTTMELYSMEIKPTIRLVLWISVAQQLQLDSGNQHTLDLVLCLLQVEQRYPSLQMYKRTRYCSTLLDLPFQICLSFIFRQVLYSLSVVVQRKLPSITTSLLLLHSLQRIMDQSAQTLPPPKTTVNSLQYQQAVKLITELFCLVLIMEIHSELLHCLPQQSMFTNQSLDRSVMHLSLLVETLHPHLFPTGMDLVLLICLVEMVTTYHHILSLLEDSLHLVSVEKRRLNITIFLLSMFTVQKIMDLYLQQQEPPKIKDLSMQILHNM